MTDHNEIGKRIQQYLDEIEAHLDQPHSQKSEVLQNVEVHIRDALARKSENNPNLDDLEAVIAEMDAPESYGERPQTKQLGSVMKPLICVAVALTAILGIWLISTVKKGSTASAPSELIGITKADLTRQLGEPSQVAGSTYEYPDHGLSVMVKDDRVIQYIIKRGSTRHTSAGVSIGTPLSDITGLYGAYESEEDVEKWFAGDESGVLYHHGKYNKYKINYPEEHLTFIFDKNKRVESIWVGFPPHRAKEPQPEN